MIAFVLALIMMFVIMVGAGAFLIWVIREHRLANKYRYLIRLRSQLSDEELRGAYNKGCTAPKWMVSYKSRNGKIEQEKIEASSDGEAVGKFMAATKIGHEKIVKVEKC